MQMDTEATVYLDLVLGRHMLQQEVNKKSKDWFMSLCNITSDISVVAIFKHTD
jgi:hypothetical protein